MKRFDFNKLHNNRRSFINSNEQDDHKVVIGNNKVLLSAPHGVSQIRLGKLKYKEIGSLATAIYLQEKTGSYLIAKTKNSNDDANFDVDCSYRKEMRQIVKDNDIKYIIDFHGLSPKRNIDVNLGIHFGKNIETNENLFNILYNDLTMHGYTCTIDQPFMAGNRTVSGGMKEEFPYLWTIQIEINRDITNYINNSTKYERLLGILEDWINQIILEEKANQ